jgi:hypothetical protein
MAAREDEDVGRRWSVQYFTLRNTAIMGLVQVGIVVAGVLGAGAVHKWYTTVGLSPPSPTALLSQYGYLALGLPIAWTALALVALYRCDPAEDNGFLPVTSGVALLVLCLFGTWYGAVSPFLRLLTCSCSLGS